MTNDKVKKYVIPNLPYLMIFWFFSKCGEAYRLAPGNDTLDKFVASIAALGAIFWTRLRKT